MSVLALGVVLAVALQAPWAAESDPPTRAAASPSTTLDVRGPDHEAAVRKQVLELARRRSDQEPVGAPLTQSEKEAPAPATPEPDFETPAFREDRERNERRKANRRSAGAKTERRRSRGRYKRRSRSEALQVARDELPAVVGEPAWRPLDLGRGERLGALQGRDGALIVVPGEDGEELVVAESTTPVQSGVGSGELAAVDLSLEERGSDFVPENPVVPTAIAKDVDAGVSLGGSGVTVVSADVSDPPVVTGGQVFFANSRDTEVGGTDTDLIVRPQPGGVSFSWQLRSEASPEEGRLSFDLPPGATLEPDERGDTKGAQVVRDGKMLLTVEPPAAFDADGESVPISYAIEGDDLVVRFPHRDGDWRYPIYADPEIVDQYSLNLDGSPGGCDPGLGWPAGWYAQSSSGGFQYHSNWGDAYFWRNAKWWAWDDFSSGSCGLWLKPTRDQGGYARGEYAQWVHNTPPGRSATFWRAQFRSSQLEGWSCMFQGIWAPTKNNWEVGEWHHPTSPPAYGNKGRSPWLYNQDAGYESNACASFAENNKAHYGEQTENNVAVLGMELQGNPTTRTPDVRMKGALLYLTDFDAPRLSASYSNLPSGWVHRATPTVHASAYEPGPRPGTNNSPPGLGVKYFNLYYPKTNGNWYGTYQLNQAVHGCSGTRHARCPADWGANLSYDTATGPEGVLTNYLEAYDVLVKQDPGQQKAWTTKVDRTAPSAVLGGSLYSDRGSFITNDSQTLTVTARDRKPGPTDQELQVAGVQSVAYEIKRSDTGQVVRSGSDSNASCHPQNGCSPDFSRQFNVDFAGLASAKYDIKVTTKDQLGDDPTHGPSHRNVQSFSVEVDRTPPEVTSISTTPRWLKDGGVGRTTVSATDDRAGIKSFRLGFPGGGEASIVRNCGGLTAGGSPPRCQSSDSATFEYSVDGTRFPAEGRVEVRGTATDAAGNQSAPRQGDVGIDRSPPELSLGGTLYLSKDALLVLDSYQLTLDAEDGSNDSPETARSGARLVRVEVKKEGEDEQFVEKFRTAEQACPQDSCALEGEWTLQTSEYERGKRYTIRVTATDQLGQATVEEFEVYVAGALGDALPVLPERLGLEDFWHYDSTATGAGSAAHTNLSTGNLVWHHTPITNAGRGLSTVANLTYNSQESQRDALRPESLGGDLLGQYNEVGRGFSLGISGVTRLNEPLDLSQLAAGKVELTDADGSRHLFESPAGSPEFGEVFTPPPGVQLHLRRWSKPKALIDPVFGAGALEQPDKAFAMTRPDGVTYFFDQLGYQTLIRDRNGNELRFRYEYRSPTNVVCSSADPALEPPDRVCVRKVVEVIDPAGRSLAIRYKPRRIADLTASLTPPEGLPQGQELETSEPVGPVPAQASGPVASITDHAGRVYEFAYDADGYLTGLTEAKAATDPDGDLDERSWLFGYEPSASSPLVKRRALNVVRDPNGKATTFVHRSDSTEEGQEECGNRSDDSGELGDGILHRRRVKTLTDRGEQGAAPGEESRTFTYTCTTESDRDFARAEVIDARDFAWRHKMDSLGKPVELVDPKDTKTVVEWDGDNNPNEITQAAGTGDEVVTSMTYNENGQLLDSTDPEAHTTTLAYEVAKGISGLHSPRTPIGETDSIDADRGYVTDLTSITRPKGNSTSFEYDDRGNVRFTTDGEGHVAETAYDALGQITDEWDQVRNHTRYEQHDPNGLPRRVTDPRAKLWQYDYDSVGNVTSVADPRADGRCSGRAFTTRLTYDNYDRLFQEVVPKDSANCEFITRKRRYDRNGNPVRQVDGNGKTWQRTYTAMDLLDEDRSPEFEHGRPDLPDPVIGSEISKREYDSEDQLVEQTAPLGMRPGAAVDSFSTRFELDEVGRRVVVRRRARGAANVDLVTSYAYDRRDNVLGVVDAAHNAAGGDPVANAQTTAKRRFTYRYDKANNRTEEIEDPGDKAYLTSYGYDANDNLATVTDPRGVAEGGYTTERFYDGNDRLEKVTDAEGRTTEYERRPDGKPGSITRPKGVASEEQGDHQTRLEYWPTGELRSRTLPFAGDQYGSHDLKVQYQLNDVGDPSTIIDARGKTITNRFLDSGELEFTSRASWWTMRGGQVQERSPQTPGGGTPAGARPPTGGHGDFGGVGRSPMPSLLPAAGEATLSYDDELRLAGVTDAAEDAAVSIQRDPLGRVTEVRRPLDAARDIAEKTLHDFNGNPVRITDPLGEVTTRSYDQFDRLVEETRPGSPESETTTRSYFPNGTLRNVVTPRGAGFDYEYGYDALDRRIRSEDPVGNVTTRDYDEVGNVVTERSPRGNRSPFPADEQRDWYDTTRKYNAVNELIEMRNGAGHLWRFEYDKNGNETLIDAPGAARGPDEGEQRELTDRSYDGLDRLWTETQGSSDNGDDRKRTRVWEYDPNGYLRRVVNPAGIDDATGLPRFTYTSDTQVSSAPEAAKNATVFEYNDPADPALMSAKRLPWGERDAQDSVEYRQTFAYSNRGFLNRVDPPHTDSPVDAAKTTYTHFNTGWIKSAQDSHKTIDYDYDRRGDQLRWASTKKGDSQVGRVMTRSYWPSGLLQSRTGRKTADAADKLRYSYSYNPNRSLTRMVNERPDDPSKRRETSYAYDSAERQVRVDEAAFEVGEDLRRGKDALLRYDENGNVLERRTDGRFTADEYVGGKTTMFTFDRLDREASMAVSAVGETDRRTSTDWWPSGEQRSQTTVRPGAGEDTVERHFFFSEGRIARKDRRRVGAPGGSFAKNQSYQYDINGNRTSDERGSHGYNSRDQLVRWEKPDGGATTIYKLNGSGSILEQTKDAITTTFDYGPDGERLRSATTQGVTTTYSYDEGGLGEIVGYSSPGSSGTTFAYDEFGRQTRSENDQGKAASFTYDGLDRRDTKSEAGRVFDLSYVGSSESLSQEQQFGGAETRSYDYDSGMQRLGTARRTATRPVAPYRAYSKDANGSVEGLEDEHGEVSERDKYAYDPYGQSASTSANPTAEEEQNGPKEEDLSEDAQANPFRFEGHYYDSNSKTYDMQARPYLPQAGRFLTEDRYESAAGDLSLEADPLTQDRYAFAGGNPVNNIEYDGHYAGNEGGAQRIARYPDGNTPKARGETRAPVSEDERAIPGRTDSTGAAPVTRSASGDAPLTDAGSTGAGQARPPAVAPVPVPNSAGPCKTGSSGLAAGSPNECGPPTATEIQTQDRCTTAWRDDCYEYERIGGDGSLSVLDILPGGATLMGVRAAVGVARRGFARIAGRGAAGADDATKGAEILPKPVVDNPKLGNIVTDLYKGTTNPNRVGTGTTADAIRNELATGQATAGRFHAQKGLEYERGLGNFLRRNPSASYRDRLTAQSLLDDLRSARGGP